MEKRMEKIISGSFWRKKTKVNHENETSSETIGLCQVICEAIRLPQEEKLVITQELYGIFAITARSYTDFLASYQEETVRDIILETAAPSLTTTVQESSSFDVNCSNSEQKIQEKNLTPEEQLDPDLAAFLDASNPKEKLEMLYRIKKRLNEYLMSSIEISMDLPVGENSLEERLEYVRRHLQTVSRFESSRLRE